MLPNDQAVLIATLKSKVMEASNTASLLKSCFNDFDGLFEAISELSSEDSTVHGLAGIGRYLSDDWGYLIECSVKDLETGLNELYAMEGLPPKLPLPTRVRPRKTIDVV